MGCEICKRQDELGSVFLGIELGSTRIKTVLIGEEAEIIAEGSSLWENKLRQGFWTYDLEEVWHGVQDSYAACARQVLERYDVELTRLGGIGISAMMHGYLVFDEKDELLVPFRTWRNTNTGVAANRLTELFHYNIPLRWNVAHLYQALLNQEEHVTQIQSLMTLAEYVHWKLSGCKVTGIGDASGMFPIDTATLSYDQAMLNKFNTLPEVRDMPWKLEQILPRPLLAGQDAGVLTEEGAKLLDISGKLLPGIPMCAPEGDAQTGMVATNSVREKTGNISAGTSDFAILLLEREPSEVYQEVDLVTSPTGKLAANIHCNNCTSDLNEWIFLFRQVLAAVGQEVDVSRLFEMFYQKALEGDADAGSLLIYNYFSGEGITKLEEGRPLLVRSPESKFTLENLMRAHMYAAMATLKIGMSIITEKEGMHFDKIMGHGGFFKTKGVGQKILADVLDMPITVMDTADQGGAWGMALLAKYHQEKQSLTLEDWLEQKVFLATHGTTIAPDSQGVQGFLTFYERYQKGLNIERVAVQYFDS